MNFEDNACVCGAGSATVFCPARDINFGATDQVSEMMRCNACGSLYPRVFPSRETVGEAYRSYYTSAKADGSRLRRQRLLRYLKGAHGLRHIPQNAALRVLDYGCGDGQFLREVHAAAPACTLFGTDVIRPDASQIRSFEWLEIDEIGAGGRIYDVITLNHVIEHLHDPIGTLKGLLPHLAPGGWLWIATPNADSFLFDCFKDYARDTDFPRHRQIFSTAALMSTIGGLGTMRMLAPSKINTVLNYVSCLRLFIKGQKKGIVAADSNFLRSVGRALKCICSSQAEISKNESAELELIIFNSY